METLQDRSSASDNGPSARSQREGRLGRIAGHTRGLVDDLREWIDLRLDLAILELEERVDELRNEVTLGITLAFFGFFAALFVFATAAFGLGWLLGHPFWGFLIVSAVLVLLVLVLARARPTLAPPSNLYARLRGKADDVDGAEDPSADASPSGADGTS